MVALTYLENKMDTIVLFSFGILCLVAIAVKRLSKSDSKDDSAKGGIEDFSDEAKYKRLKIKFFAAYFLALFGDWLQGPYVYQLYASYGFAENIIGTVIMYTYMNVNNTLKYYRSHFG